MLYLSLIMMSVTENKTRIKISILAASLFYMSTVGLSAAIADIAGFFPSYSVQVIQTGITTISLVGIIGALAVGVLAFSRSKKILILFGLALVLIGGFCGFFVHGTLLLLYAWSVVIGAGAGMFQPLISSLLADYFEGVERNQLAGIQTAFVSGGGVLLAFVGGLLAMIAWHFSYLVHLIALPLFVICALNLPRENKYPTQKGQKQTIPRCVYYYIVTVFSLALVYNVFPSNIALYLSEKDLGAASMAGAVNAVFMGGGVFMGFVFSRISMRIGEYLFAISYLVLVICFVILCLSYSIIPVFVAAFIGGSSISMTMPQAMFSVSGKIPLATSAAVFSLMATISPNLGNFVSPAVIAFASRMVSDAGDSISRFVTALILGAVLMVVQFVVTMRANRAERAALQERGI